MATLTHYRVRSQDTLESIAARLLGDEGRWQELVTLNRLRAPFISDDPQYRLGPIVVSGELATALPQGTAAVRLPLGTTALARKDMVLHLQERDPATGTYRSEVLTVAQPGQAQPDGRVLVSLTSPTTRAYDPYALWALHTRADTAPTVVLKTGDYLRLPSDAQNGEPTVAPSTRLAERLGTDLAVNARTHGLAWDPQTHDLALVHGTANLAQAVTLRLSTEPGELTYHPTYGNRLISFVGSKQTRSFSALVEGLIRDCMNDEARLERVEKITVGVRGDVVTVDLVAMLRGLGQLLEINSLNIPLPG